MTADQTQTVHDALDPIEVVDAKGNFLGTLAPIWTREEIALAKQILADPTMEWYTFDEVMAHLRSLNVS